MLILVGVSVQVVIKSNLLDTAVNTQELQRATYIEEQIALTLQENQIYKYSLGNCITKDNLILRLQNEGNLTPEEVAILKTNDIIEIGGKTIDFSVLKISLIISESELILEITDDGTLETKKLTANSKNMSGNIEWEIIEGANYITIQQNTGNSINLQAKSKGRAKIVAKCGEYTSEPCEIIVTTLISVSNDSELKTALNNAEAGDTICLQSGTYQDEILLCKEDNSTPINSLNIKAIGNVKVSAIDLKGSSNIVIDGLTFDCSNAVEAKKHNNVKSSYYSSIYDNNINRAGARDIIIKNCVFEGTPPEGVNYICIHNNDQGFSGTRTTDIEISGCEFYCNAFSYVNFSYAINGDINLFNNIFGGDEFSTSYANIFFSSGHANLTVTGNKFTNWAIGNVAIELMGPADSEISPTNIPILTVTDNTFYKTTPPSETELVIKYRRGRTEFNLSNNNYTGTINYFNDENSIDHTVHASIQN